MRRVGLANWVEVRQDRAEELAAAWTSPVDLLVLDGNQSRAGARAAYENWLPFLESGGTIAVHNTAPRVSSRIMMETDDSLSKRYCRRALPTCG